MAAFAKNLENALANTGMARRRLAEFAGVPSQSVEDWINGIWEPDPAIIRKIADGLILYTPQQLMEETIEPDPAEDNYKQKGRRRAAELQSIVFVRHFDQYLKRYDLTSKSCAEKLGVAQTTVLAWRKGELTPNSRLIHPIASILGIGYSYLRKTRAEDYVIFRVCQDDYYQEWKTGFALKEALRERGLTLPEFVECSGLSLQETCMLLQGCLLPGRREARELSEAVAFPHNLFSCAVGPLMQTSEQKNPWWEHSERPGQAMLLSTLFQMSEMNMSELAKHCQCSPACLYLAASGLSGLDHKKYGQLLPVVPGLELLHDLDV